MGLLCDQLIGQMLRTSHNVREEVAIYTGASVVFFKVNKEQSCSGSEEMADMTLCIFM